MCVHCYWNPNFIDKRCGICRIQMKNPSRNRIAENHVNKMLVCCEQDGCTKRMEYSIMDDHIKNDCQHVVVDCDYMILGCNWKGPRGLKNSHEHNNFDYCKILRQTNKLHDDNKRLTNLWNDVKDLCEECDESFDKYNRIIAQSDINAEFDLRHIWNEFRMKNDDDLRQGLYDTVLRFTGNRNRTYKLTLYFRPSHREYFDETMHYIEYKISVKCDTKLENRYFQSVVLPSIPDGNKFIHFDIPEPMHERIECMIDEGMCVEEWNLYDWKQLVRIEADTIEHANTIMNDNDCGIIKVFGCHIAV